MTVKEFLSGLEGIERFELFLGFLVLKIKLDHLVSFFLPLSDLSNIEDFILSLAPSKKSPGFKLDLLLDVVNKLAGLTYQSEYPMV